MVVVLPSGPPAVFIDASAYVALALSSDAHHDEAVGVARRLQSEAWQFFTTQVMVAEAHALLLRDLGRDLAFRFLRDVYMSESTTVERPGFDDEKRAFTILDTYKDKDFSFADALAFAVARRIGIRYAFSYDRHFRQYGALHVFTTATSW